MYYTTLKQHLYQSLNSSGTVVVLYYTTLKPVRDVFATINMYSSSVVLHYSKTSSDSPLSRRLYSSSVVLHYSKTSTVGDISYGKYSSSVVLHYSKTACVQGLSCYWYSSSVVLHYSKTNLMCSQMVRLYSSSVVLRYGCIFCASMQKTQETFKIKKIGNSNFIKAKRSAK